MQIEYKYDANGETLDQKRALTISGEQARILIEAGADVNAKDQYGNTALTYAYNAEHALLLIHAGADIEYLAGNRNLSKSDVKIIVDTLQKEREIQAQIAKNKERLKNGPKLKGKSGVVIADEIAKRQISGEEKRVITPEVGKELRQEIMKEWSTKKSLGE
ncbi:MAG: hypothetical protein IJ870_05340 [Alphaproteobacteria bacterium]|nr:hypothetical protein [Alphaproteobacteria bacterium]